MSGIKSSNAIFLKLKFSKNLSLEKSNKYALDLINNPNTTLDDLIKFSRLVTFDKEIFFEKFLELNNIDIIVGYLDFLIDSGNRDFIHIKCFDEIFKIYIKNTNKDIQIFILNSYYCLDLDLLVFIFNYYYGKNEHIINTIICDISSLIDLIDKLDEEKIDYIKQYVFILMQKTEYSTAEKILNILIDKKIVDSNYIKKFERTLLDKSVNDSITRKFTIKYYRNNIDSEGFKERGDHILNYIVKDSSNEDIYYIVKFLLIKGEFDKAFYVSKFVKITDKSLDMGYYNRILKLPIPMAVILEKDKYLDKKLILNIIKKDKLRLYVYGQDIINGYNFNDHEKNIYLDNKYTELLKNNTDCQVFDDKIEKEVNRISLLMVKVNRYNTFFQKNVL